MKRMTLSVLLSALILSVVLTGCEREGPLERTGERVDEAVENVGDSAEKAGDRMQR
jgi:predicted small lipoprotein YifL